MLAVLPGEGFGERPLLSAPILLTACLPQAQKLISLESMKQENAGGTHKSPGKKKTLKIDLDLPPQGKKGIETPWANTSNPSQSKMLASFDLPVPVVKKEYCLRRRTTPYCPRTPHSGLKH